MPMTVTEPPFGPVLATWPAEWQVVQGEAATAEWRMVQTPKFGEPGG
jgi:hypothetical protein